MKLKVLYNPRFDKVQARRAYFSVRFAHWQGKSASKFFYARKSIVIHLPFIIRCYINKKLN